MSFPRFAGALFVAAAATATAITAQEPRMPATAELQRMAARFAPTDITADVSRLSPNDRRVLGEAGRGVEDHRCVVSAAGLVGQRRDAARSGAATNARRSRAAALLPDQQGTVGSPRSLPDRSCRARRRSRKARTSIRRRDEGGARTLDAGVVRSGARAGHRVLHGDSTRPERQLVDRALQHRISERADAHRRRCCAKQRRSRPSRRSRRF